MTSREENKTIHAMEVKLNRKTKEEFYRECDSALMQCIKFEFHGVKSNEGVEYHTSLRANGSMPYWKELNSGSDEDFDIGKSQAKHLLVNMIKSRGIAVVDGERELDFEEMNNLCESNLTDYIERKLNEWKSGESE